MTNVLLQILGLAFISNVVLNAFGVSEAVRTHTHKIVHVLYVKIFFFSLILAVGAFLIMHITPHTSIKYGLIGVLTVMVLMGAILFLRMRRPNSISALSKVAALAMFNSAVLVVPLIVISNELSIASAIIAAIGVSLGFIIISVLLRCMVNNLDVASQPKSFRGLPTILIFLGIIAMAITAIGGSPLA